MSTNSHIRSFPIVVLLYLLPHPLSSGACRCLRPPPYSTAPSYNNRSATAMKRKFDIESDDSLPTNAKQLKLIPFPNCEPDNDAVMSEAEPFDPELHHTRIPSNVSSTSSCASDSPTLSSPPYPTFDLYPLPFFNNEGSVDPNSHTFSNYAAQSPTSQNVGLLQPTSSFSHHGTSCSQIPKLRVACAAGRNGQRTMWSFCEQCGAISMVDND